MLDGRADKDEIGGAPPSRPSAAVQEAALEALDAMVAMSVVDADGRFVHVSDRWCALTGWPREEVLGAHWTTVVHPDDLPPSIAEGRHVARTGSSSSHESRIRGGNGQTIWLESQITPLPDESGAIHSWLVVGTDITSHKQAAEALSRSERRLQVIFDNSTDIITILDDDGVARSTSLGGYRQLGYDDTTFPHGAPLSLLVPEDRAALTEVAEVLKRSGQRFSDTFELRVAAADGGMRWLEAVAVNLLDEPSVRSIVVHSRDVTSTLEALEGLRTMATRLDSLVSHLFVGVMLADERGEILFANRALVELCNLGPDPALLVGRPMDLLREDLRKMYADADGALARIVEILEGREPVRDERVELINGNVLARSFVPIIDDCQYRGHLWLFRDLGAEIAIAEERDLLLSMEKEQNARLVELDALRTDLLASVSHDLRTPLTSIKSFARLLRDGLETDTVEERLEFIDTIERNTDRLQRLVDDILLLDYLESNSLQLTIGPVDLVEVVRGSVASLGPTALARGVDLHLRATDGPNLTGDGDRLGQLVDNLLSNAVKFATTGGTVNVAVAPGGDGWCIEIADDGIGIPTDEIEHLFQRFYRASNARREAITGSGLGLSIAMRVAQLHRGTIRVDSREGRGTTVVVELSGAEDNEPLSALLPPTLSRARS